MWLHILCKSRILYLGIAVDVFGLHLGEPDASGSLFYGIYYFAKFSNKPIIFGTPARFQVSHFGGFAIF